MDLKHCPKKRTTNFREDETKLLIQLWGSPTVQNKLYLTHRKAPVMRLIAHNMQKHGFYRTPDEIKTRIRNLKCLYHRMKKSMANGNYNGQVDPFWPHFKAMDEILSKKNSLRQSLVYNHNLLSEVNAEVKEEIVDIEIPEDVDSKSSNSNGSDDEFEEPYIPATITPIIIEEPQPYTIPIKIAPKPSSPSPSPTIPPKFPRIQVAQNLKTPPPPKMSAAPTIVSNTAPKISNMTTIPKLQTNGVNKNLPFPLLILNNQGAGIQKNINVAGNVGNNGFNNEVSSILKEMLFIQKQNLEVERERLEVERQKLDYERAVGSQLLNMVPAFNEIFQRFKEPEEEVPVDEPEDTKIFVEHPTFGKRHAEDPLTPLKSSKVLKEAVVDGIKKYMQDKSTENIQ